MDRFLELRDCLSFKFLRRAYQNYVISPAFDEGRNKPRGF